MNLSANQKQTQTWRRKLWLPSGEGAGWTVSLGLVDAAITFRIDKQRSPTAYHKKLQSPGVNRNGKDYEKRMHTYMCVCVYI